MGGQGYMNRPMGGQGYMNRPPAQHGYINQPKAAPKTPLNLGNPKANPTPKMQPPQQPTPAPGFEAWEKNQAARAQEHARQQQQQLDPTWMPSVLTNKGALEWSNNMQRLQDAQKAGPPKPPPMNPVMPPAPNDLPGNGADIKTLQEMRYQEWLRQQNEWNRQNGRPPNTVPPGGVPKEFWNKSAGGAVNPNSLYATYGPKVLQGLFG